MRRDQQGSALILALAMLTAIGLILSALLGFASSATNAAVTIRDQGKRIYAADAGIERAIQGIRYNPELGRDPAEGGSCPSFTLPGVNSKTVTVTCNGLSGSGAQNGGPNHPRNAIMTLSNAVGESGINQSSNNTMRIRGAVKSNSDITTSSSSVMDVDGLVRARSACTSGVLSTDKICNIGVAPPGVVDPQYPAEVSTEPASPASIPTCPPSPDWKVTMLPGTYSSVAPLNALTSGCNNLVVHFTPGVYYFNYTGIWNFNANDLHVVAGTPSGSWSTALTRPTMPFPGACDLTAAGVQFIFAGDARMAISKGWVELCPTPHVSAQRITIYQRGLGSGTFARPSGCVAQAPYTGSACALLSASGPQVRFISHGTVYAPAAVVDFQLQQQSEQLLGRGIVARIFRVHMTASSLVSGYIIQVPDTGAADREVEFIATVEGAARVRAVVVLEDGGGDLPGQTVRITSWSVRR